MSAVLAVLTGTSALWLATRATGVGAFVLLTASFGLGLVATRRGLARRRWPRFASQQLHRNVTLLALAMLVVHVVTTLLDSYVHVGWWAWIIPGVSGYLPLAVALGTVAFDLIIVLVATSLLRARMSGRSWRLIHGAAYVAWPLAFLHFLLAGTDAASGGWGTYLAGACLMVLGLAAGARWLVPDTWERPLRSVTGRPR
ncbi:MAG TPA: ferric reductase-like transmembrane domain-containing protein [Marmoricola sp.]|nr:ferric reductase-like transmembrane domain-containing protein [Marmoricola sp.]